MQNKNALHRGGGAVFQFHLNQHRLIGDSKLSFRCDCLCPGMDWETVDPAFDFQVLARPQHPDDP